MRIIAGIHRGRRLITPRDDQVRPTADRAREALFNILEHAEPRLREARFLDLFCGTGAVGLEALSRGAAEVLLVDQEPALARANLAALAVEAGVRIEALDASRLPAHPGPGFDIAFLDPPYRSGLAMPTLRGLARGWLRPGAAVVVELAAKEGLDPPPGFQPEQRRRYGASVFEFLCFAGSG